MLTSEPADGSHLQAVSLPHLVVFTGSGISVESGIKTFRASDGLWEEHPVEKVATPEGFRDDPERVLAFYDQRRAQIRKAKPNAAHKALAALEQDGFSVSIITQNIDDLHERAGSSHVLHLHGEILKARSTVDARLRYPVTGNIALGEVCDKGSQLRPDVVWFGESVPLFDQACELASQADFFLVVGTSLAVMPAASLLSYIGAETPCALIDPDADALTPPGVLAINTTAGEGVPALVNQWRRQRSFELS
ncbi:SIR2 family NAD-dependent protein deacylase [Vreelandella sp. TE19]